MLQGPLGPARRHGAGARVARAARRSPSSGPRCRSWLSPEGDRVSPTDDLAPSSSLAVRPCSRWARSCLRRSTLCWPMLGGILLGDDQYVAGYGFRLFGAEMFRQTGHIPEWNPYLFGGLPFIAAMHGDIFYPTAWLRWVLPIDTAMNLGFAGHIVLAGATMYALAPGDSGPAGPARSWAGSPTSSPASWPRWSSRDTTASSSCRRWRRWRSWRCSVPSGPVAPTATACWRSTVGLCMLSPHYQMTYYLLVAAGLWTLYLVFFDPERAAGRAAWPRVLGFALGGGRCSGSPSRPSRCCRSSSTSRTRPRAAGGPSGGWEYATGFSMPPEEIVTTVLPQFNGVLEHYWGRNFFKLHTEYLGAVVVVLAALGFGGRAAPAPGPGPGRHRAPLPAGRVRRAHAVLPALVRSDADDEEGARPRHGVLPRGAAGRGLRRLRGGAPDRAAR